MLTFTVPSTGLVKIERVIGTAHKLQVLYSIFRLVSTREKGTHSCLKIEATKISGVLGNGYHLNHKKSRSESSLRFKKDQ